MKKTKKVKRALVMRGKLRVTLLAIVGEAAEVRVELYRKGVGVLWHTTTLKLRPGDDLEVSGMSVSLTIRGFSLALKEGVL